jgi:hypothetical protein
MQQLSKRQTFHYAYKALSSGNLRLQPIVHSRRRKTILESVGMMHSFSHQTVGDVIRPLSTFCTCGKRNEKNSISSSFPHLVLC